MWKMLNYEVCGRSHLKSEIPCQDKTISKRHNETCVIALADGAGSAIYSHFGAEVVVKLISNLLSEDFDNLINEENGYNVKKRILNMLIEGLEYESLKLNCKIKDLASTLLAVAIKNENFIAMHLGDGVIGMIKNNEMKVASKPQNGEFSNSTIFVTSQNAIQSLRLYKGSTKNIDGFVIMSDGTAESFYDKRKETLSPRMREIFDFSTIKSETVMSSELKNFFNRVIRNRTFDDCSMALIVKGNKCNDIYNNFNLKQKNRILDVKNNNMKLSTKITTEKAVQKVCKYERILRVLNNYPCTIEALAKKVYVNKQYLKGSVNHLETIGLLERFNSKYFSYISPS